MKDWLFYNFFETAFPQNESYVRNFFTFDTDRSGVTSLWNWSEASVHFPREFQAASGDVLSALFQPEAPWINFSWFEPGDKAVYFDSTPVCASLVYDVQGEFSSHATLLNNQLTDSGPVIDRYFLPTFPGVEQTAESAQLQEVVTAVDEHARYQRTVGPTLLDMAPYTSVSGQPAWLFSELRADYNPMYN